MAEQLSNREKNSYSLDLEKKFSFNKNSVFILNLFSEHQDKVIILLL